LKVKNKLKETVSVGAAVIGAVGNSLINSDVKNNKVGKKSIGNVEKINKSSNKKIEEISDSTKKVDKIKKDSIGKNGEVKKSSLIKNKLKENFGVGAAVLGSIGSVLINNINRSSKNKSDDKYDKKKYLAANIIKKMKDEIEDNLNLISVLESELFLLNEKNKNELSLEKCKEIRKRIEELIEKINHIILQYNIYKSNRFLDNMLDIDSSDLIDDIIEYKRFYSVSDLKRSFYGDYNLVNDYKKLYQRLDEIKDDVLNLYKDNYDKLKDIDIRDKKYEFIKDKIVDIDKINKDCERFISNQNKYIDDINEKVSQIDIRDVVSYRMKGFGDLVGGTFRYLSLLMLSPFMGVFPSIAVSTYAANRMVKNLYKALTLEKITTVVYSANDLQNELSRKINDLDYNYNNVEVTLDNIHKLKNEFKNQYSSNIPGYDETLRKINDIERLVYNNKCRLDLIKKRLIERKKINEKTLVKVKTLEKESKSVV